MKKNFRIVLSSFSVLLLAASIACTDNGVGEIADDQPSYLLPDGGFTVPTTDSPDGIGTSPSDPEDGAGFSAHLPIKPGTRWCAYPSSCKDPDAACCKAVCEAAPDGTPLCSND